MLAHFIGDYLLQFNRIYALKHKGLKGIIPHVLLVVLCFIILSWPYLGLSSMWIFIAYIGIVHLFQDWIKIELTKIREERFFWYYLYDQLIHVLTIMAVFLTPLKNLSYPKNPANFLLPIYNNNIAMLYLIALIVATYNGFYMIINIRKTFLKSQYAYSEFEKQFGMLERAIIVSLFFVKLPFLSPLVFGLRPLLFKLSKGKINAEFVSSTEAAMSWFIGIGTGGLFYLLIYFLLKGGPV